MSIEKKTGIHGTSPIDCRLVSQELYKKDRTLWEKLPRLVQGDYNSVSLYEQAIDAYSARFDELVTAFVVSLSNQLRGNDVDVSPETYYLLALQDFKKRNNVAEKIPELCKRVRTVDLKYLGKFDYMNEGELKTALAGFHVPIPNLIGEESKSINAKVSKKPLIVDGKKFFKFWDYIEVDDGSLSGVSDEFLNSIWADSS